MEFGPKHEVQIITDNPTCKATSMIIVLVSRSGMLRVWTNTKREGELGS